MEINEKIMLRLGYAQTDITPIVPVKTIGFNKDDNNAYGVLKPLLAQVAVWSEKELCCLITIDSIGFKKELCDSLRKRVCEAIGTTFDKVMVCFSHCHSAPNADTVSEYYKMLCEKVEVAARQANEHLGTVCAGWGNAHVAIGINRREGNRNLDNRLGVLKICDAKDNTTRLILIRVTAHCNTLKRDNDMISPDYFGDIREILKGYYQCPVMVIQGAAGNIAPKYFKSKETPIDARGEQFIRSETALEDIAQEVFKQAGPIIDIIKTTKDASVQMYSNSIVLYAEVPAYEQACVVAKEAMDNCGIDGTDWLAEVRRLNTGGIKTQEETVEVQYLQIGEGCLCGVPHEIMVEFALKAMERRKDEFFYFNGYTNGCLSYFPTEEEFDLGGYEVYWSMLLYYSYFNRVFPLVRESAEKLIDFVVNNKH